MPLRSVVYFCTIPLFFLTLASGCGSSTPPLTSVTGTVSYQGQPLNTGTIVFTPDSAKGAEGPISTGKIMADGSFSLTTGNAVGAAPGWHRITVVSISEASASIPGQRFTVPVSLIPVKYRNPESSDLTREVKNSAKNVFHLNLQ